MFVQTTRTLLDEAVYYQDGRKPLFNGCPSGYSIAPSGRYDFTFDDRNRLVAADYIPAASESADADFSAEYSYDAIANPLKVKRYGVVGVDAEGNETFGLLDGLNYSYGSGSKVSKIKRTGEGVDFYGRSGFPCVETAQFSWNKAGALTSDPARGIENISYGPRGLTDTIAYSDGTLQIWRHTSDSVLIGVRTIEPGGRFKRASERQYRGRRIFVDYGLEYSAFEGGYFDASGAPHFYHTDYRGNIVMVTDSAGEVVQRTSYYPYGEPHRLPQGQPYLFASKERHPRTGATLFGPRDLLTSAIFWSAPDAHSGKYTGLSPWSYCGGNPIAAIDLNGKDIFVFDTDGHLIKTIKDQENDILEVASAESIVFSDEFEYGTISKMKEHVDIEFGKFLVFKVEGTANATKAFEFLADNTNVEFSVLKCGIPGPKAGQNFITTSYGHNIDFGAGHMIGYQLRFGYSLNTYVHSHPSKNDKISGADSDMANNINRFFVTQPKSYL